MAKKFLFLSLALCLAVSLAGVAAAADTIKIGFNAPLTGFAASDGKSSTEGAKLAVKQINAAGGVLGKKLELIIYDDQAKPSQAIPIANKMIGQDKVVVGISGSYSGATRSAAGVFQEAKIPYISAYAIHPDITRAGEYVFRTSFLGQVQGKAGAKLIGEMMGKKKWCSSPCRTTSASPWPRASRRWPPNTASRSRASIPTPSRTASSAPSWPRSRPTSPMPSMPAAITSPPAPWLASCAPRA
jgi:hypothetical protein